MTVLNWKISQMYQNGIWNITNVTDISYLFYGCKSAKKLPDISKWDISKITNICVLFQKCEVVEELPYISKWNISNVNEKNVLFSKDVLN